MSFMDLLMGMGEEVTDANEEAYTLYCGMKLSLDLGMVAPQATTLELSVAGKDLTISQSPGILSSNRALGTTGAVVWKASILFAEWLASSRCPLFQTVVFHSTTTVLELGCGISGILAMTLATKIGQYTATDQDYVLKRLKQNLEDNCKLGDRAIAARLKSGKVASSKSAKGRQHNFHGLNIQVMPLDWENNHPRDLAHALGGDSDVDNFSGVDALIACDCIFNEALVQPFVQTCTSLCKFRHEKLQLKPALCLIVQQLRSAEVLEMWLRAMLEHFRVWRLKDRFLTAELSESGAYVIYLAVLKHDKRFTSTSDPYS